MEDIRAAHKQLEKVLTYYSEHLLSQIERETIASDLHYLSDEEFSRGKTSYVNLLPFFSNEKSKLKDFAKFLGLSVFVGNLFEH